MIRLFDPEAPANPPRLTDGAPARPAAPRGSQSHRARFHLDLMRSLRTQSSLALGFAVAGVILAALYTFCNWSVYTAQSVISIQPPPTVLTEATPTHWPYHDDPVDSYIQKQMLSMARPDVLAGAVHKLAPGVWQQSGESDQSAADRLYGAVEVARVGNSYQVAITAHADNPDTAAALANAVAASYIENTARERKACDAGRVALLEEEQQRIRQCMDDDRAEQAMLHAQLSVAALGPKATQYYVSDIGLVRAELATARSDHDEAAARLTSIDSGGDLSSAALSAEADQIIATDPGLSSLRQALLTRRAELVSQMSGATPDDPLYMQDQEELEKIDASLESETEDARAMASAPIEEQLRSDLERTASIEAHLNNELAQMTEGAPGATPKLQRSSDLANDITRLQNRYNTVEEKLQKTQEDSASTRLAEAAVPPPYPASAGVIRNALLLLLAFILVGVAAAVLAHKSERHVYVASHVSDIAPQVASAPSSQLPDVEEVSNEAAEEHLPSQAAPLVLENKVAQSVPQPAPSAPSAPQDTPTSAAPRDMEPELPWFAGNASRPVFKPLGLIMSATPGIDLPTPQPESEAEPRPDQQPQEETSGFLMENPPWWMTKTNSYVEPPMKAPLEPRVEAWPAAAVPIEQTPAVTEARKMETVTDARKMETVAEARKTENIADEMPTRLSALRTIVFSLGIKEFGQKKTARREGSGAGIGNTSSATADSAPVYPGQAIGVEHLAPHTQHEPVEDNDENPIARKETPRWVTAKPEFFSWRAEETNKAGESRRNPVIFDGGPDDLQILPSQPGQYRR